MPREKQTLHLNVGSEIATLDPRMACDDASSLLIMMLYDGLVRIDESKTPQLSIAHALEISSDKTIFTFQLKKTKFANGENLTAHDFVSTLQSCVNPKRPSDNLSEYFILKNARAISMDKLPIDELGVRAIDDYTLEFVLENSCPHFLNVLASWIFYPLPKNVEKKYPDFSYGLDKFKINNGPFILKKWNHRDQIVLEKNPHYWDRNNVFLDEIILEMIEDEVSELELFKQGKLDFAGGPVSGGLPHQALDSLANEGKLQIGEYCKAYWYVFNVEKGPLKNVNLRRALTYSVDRKEILDHIVKYGSKIAHAPFPPDYSFRNDYFENNQVKLARSYFEKALLELGINREMLQLKLSIHNSSNVRKIAETICYQWKKTLGIEVTIEINEWSLFLDKLFQKNYDMAALNTFPYYTDPIAFLDIFNDRDNPANLTGWEDAEYIACIKKAQNSANIEKRNQELSRAEQIIADNLPVLPLFFSAPMYIKNDRLEGFVITKTGGIDFKKAKLK